jgi:hypothetical protein
MGRGSIFLGTLYALLQARYLSLAPTCTIAILVTKYTYHSLSARRLSERTVLCGGSLKSQILGCQNPSNLLPPLSNHPLDPVREISKKNLG